MSNNITFVTAFMNIYDIPFQNKDVVWRFRHFRKIAQLGIPLAVFCSPDCLFEMENMVIEFPNIKVIQYLDLKDTWTYKVCDSIEGLELPNTRNIDKDTREYIILMNTKTEFLKCAIESNVWNSKHFAWIDFNIFHVFKDNEDYAGEILKILVERPLIDNFITLPGCWGKQYVHYEQLLNDICWRWCGGFFIGDANSILNLHNLYELHFKNFLERTKRLIWEVNFWAYLELEHGISIIWYPGDHNTSILEITGDVCSMKLKVDKSHKYGFSEINQFLPTSISYLKYKGDNLLNIRYVNYWLYPSGAYLIKHPESHLYTKNYFSFFDSETLDITCFNEMSEDSIGLVNIGGKIHGLEDIRLYEVDEEIYFIATNVNYSKNGRSRMIRGKYNIVDQTYDDCRIIVPPTDTWCEKNWVPIVKEGKEYFIYKWWPLEIGVINEKMDENENPVMFLQLDIIKQYKHIAPFFSHVRGSSPFIEIEEGFIGVVHFSEEKHPRHYFHILVLLDKEFKPLKYSNNFYFNNLSIEFCIGFDQKDDDYYFWISNFDRDPELIITKRSNIHLCYDFCNV